MPSVDAWIWVEIIGISVLVVIGLATGAHVASGRSGLSLESRVKPAAIVALVAGGWLAVWFTLATAQVFRADSESPIQAIAPGVGIPLVAGFLMLWRSSSFRKLLAAVPQPWLLAAQFPRVLGVTFLVLMAQGKLPEEFAIPAGWGDILIGVLGPVVAYVYATSRAGSRGLAFAFNIAGIADLVIAVGTGFLAAPSPFRLLLTTPSTELMTVLPTVLIPIFLVPTFLMLHVFSLHKLLAERSGAKLEQWRGTAAGTVT